MKKDFVIRGQTASGETEILEFGGYKEGYAYKLTEFKLWPSGNLGGADNECFGTVTANKTAATPIDPNFNDEGLIAVATVIFRTTNQMGPYVDSVINDTFLITQNLILMVQDTGAGAAPINWQCRFESVKMSDSQAAATNFKQFSIFDE
jgi:hypothetical protein